jgi:hypothetical protein
MKTETDENLQRAERFTTLVANFLLQEHIPSDERINFLLSWALGIAIRGGSTLVALQAFVRKSFEAYEAIERKAALDKSGG